MLRNFHSRYIFSFYFHRSESFSFLLFVFVFLVAFGLVILCVFF